jgi:hypothetical protein
MSFERIAESKIREAIARGEFDNLEGKGKPIDQDAYFAAPDDVRLAYSMLRSNGFVPEEVELRREAAALREQLGACEDPEARRRLTRALNDVLLKVDVLREHTRRSRRRR